MQQRINTQNSTLLSSGGVRFISRFFLTEESRPGFTPADAVLTERAIILIHLDQRMRVALLITLDLMQNLFCITRVFEFSSRCLLSVLLSLVVCMDVRSHVFCTHYVYLWICTVVVTVAANGDLNSQTNRPTAKAL